MKLYKTLQERCVIKMMSQKQKMPVSVVVFFCIFYGLLGLFTIEAAGVSKLSLLALGIVIIMLLYDFMTRTDFEIPMLQIQSNFISLDGTLGTVEENLTPVGGGQMRCTIAINPRYAPENTKYRMKGAKGAMAALAGRVHMDIIRPASDFLVPSGKYLGAREGAIILLGSIDPDRPVLGIDNFLKSEVEQRDLYMRKINTIVESVKAQSATDSREQAKNIIDAFQQLLPVIHQWSQSASKAQPTMVLPGSEGK